jgi:hypothetical protein
VRTHRADHATEVVTAPTSGGRSVSIVRLHGARGSVVVKALCYKPEGRGFETRRGE